MAPKSYATVANGGHGTSTPQSMRTSNRNRRPSREALEAIVTDADVRDVMGVSGAPASLPTNLPPPVATSLSSGTGTNLSSSIASSSSPTSGNGLALLSQLSQTDIRDLITAVSQFRVSPQSSSSMSTAEKKVHRTPGGASTPSVHSSIPIKSGDVPTVVDVDIDPDSEDDLELTTASPTTRDNDDCNDLVWDMMVIPASERMAANAIALCQRDHGTFRRRAMDKKCSDRRNAREIDVLSLVFDALIANRNDVAMELIARRIVGIEEADSSGNWHIADAIQVMRTGSLMSEQHRRHFVKVAKLLDKDKKDSSGAGSSRVSSRVTKKAPHRIRTKTKQSSSTAAASSTSSATGKS